MRFVMPRFPAQRFTQLCESRDYRLPVSLQMCNTGHPKMEKAGRHLRWRIIRIPLNSGFLARSTLSSVIS